MVRPHSLRLTPQGLPLHARRSMPLFEKSNVLVMYVHLVIRKLYALIKTLCPLADRPAQVSALVPWLGTSLHAAAYRKDLTGKDPRASFRRPLLSQ